MNIRNVKIAIIPEEYVSLISRSQAQRELFLDVEKLKSILSPAEVEFYTALNKLGISIKDSCTLYPNVHGGGYWREKNPPYAMPDGINWKGGSSGFELTENVKARLLDALRSSERASSNRQELLESIARGVIPVDQIGVRVAYADPTCLFLQLTSWNESYNERVLYSSKAIYEGLHQCGLFDLGFGQDYESWFGFCGALLDKVIRFDEINSLKAA